MIENPSYHIVLFFHNGPYAQRPYELQYANTSIGSAKEKNILVLADASIQPEHAIIGQDQGRIYIQGRNPESYIAVNDTQTRGAILQPGDIVTLGNAGITFQIQLKATTPSVNEEPRGYGGNANRTPFPPQSPHITSGYPVQSPHITGGYLAQQQSFVKAAPVYRSPDDVTRYLCAAVYSDEVFRELVLEHIFGDEMKAPGESYGIDVVPVVRWAFAARQRTLIRDILLMVVPFLSVLLLSLILSNVLPIFALRNAIALTTISTLIVFTSILFPLAMLALALVLLIMKPFPEEKNRRSLLMAVVAIFLTPLIIYTPIVSIAWIIVIAERLLCYFGAEARLLRRDKFRSDESGIPPLDPKLEQRLRARFPQKDGNLVTYSGYTPFAGSGLNIRGWSYIVDLTKGKTSISNQNQTPPQAFKVKELYDAQAKAINDLGLKNVQIEEKLYASGKELRNQEDAYRQEILPDEFASPKINVSPAMVKEFQEHPTEDIRYYQCIKVTTWKGDLILSIFMRFALIGNISANTNDGTKNLLIEGNYQLLTPIHEDYREVDRLASHWNMRRVWYVTKRTFIPTTFKTILGPPIRLISAIPALRKWLQNAKKMQTASEIADNPSFDYGASTSLRELVSSQEYQRYFQRLDEEMYFKIIEYQVLETAVTFLEEHNIDTRQLRARQEVIINSGTMINGGTFNARGMNIGARSSITMTGKGSDDGGQATVLMQP